MKRISRTPAIDQALKAAFGPDADTSGLAVYEMIAANLNPIRKRQGLYENARFNEGTLAQMALLLNQESRQLILNHQDGMMPVGRVFDGKMKNSNLHALFALNQNSQPQLISDLDAGIIDQVSVSVLPQQLLCSACGWDYMGDQATFENIYECTCGNGHEIGDNGVHVNISGVASFTEVSLTGMGALPGARVVSGSDSAFSQSATGLRLAAAHIPSSALLLKCSLEKPKEKSSMDPAMLARLEALAAEKATGAAELVARNAAFTAQTAELTAANAKVAELAAQVSTLTAAAAAAPDAALKPEHVALMAALSDLVKRTKIALGEKEPVVPTAAAELLAALKDGQEKLTAIIPAAGPVSRSAAQLAAETHAPAANAAYVSAPDRK